MKKSENRNLLSSPPVFGSFILQLDFSSFKIKLMYTNPFCCQSDLLFKMLSDGKIHFAVRLAVFEKNVIFGENAKTLFLFYTLSFDHILLKIDIVHL